MWLGDRVLAWHEQDPGFHLQLKGPQSKKIKAKSSQDPVGGMAAPAQVSPDDGCQSFRGGILWGCSLQASSLLSALRQRVELETPRVGLSPGSQLPPS